MSAPQPVVLSAVSGPEVSGLRQVAPLALHPHPQLLQLYRLLVELQVRLVQ